MTNISEVFRDRIELHAGGLLAIPGHPLANLWQHISKYFQEQSAIDYCTTILDPIVRVAENFDDCLIPLRHPGRDPGDSYYLNRNWMLRTHMTAHERPTMAMGRRNFLLAGHVYRRDEIDSSHYPVFHQIEGVRLFSPDEIHAASLSNDGHLSASIRSIIAEQPPRNEAGVGVVLADLHRILEGLLRSLFGPSIPIRWQATYFPFTLPSIEAEVLYEGRWLEVLGSGVLAREFLHPSVPEGSVGWAFGLGLERLAMILHRIPDIRLFWSKDARFLSQFQQTTDPLSVRFVPFSKFPPISRDVSFWSASSPAKNGICFGSPPAANDIYELVREIGGDLVEQVSLLDEYQEAGPNGRRSCCYRIVYRSMERTLTDDEINRLQASIREALVARFAIQLR